ncbi:MAG: hypothetical protein KatS3mg130_0385 [Candidatus Sumerlaea sp.]|nr:MAG: hypothetical protein KatS3mg130_0385 [Candidatus Sumerlaea sp.]
MRYFASACSSLGLRSSNTRFYARFLPSEEKAEAVVRRVREILPPEGQVRILEITGKQFEKMHVFYGTRQRPPENPPQQLELF